LIAIGNSLIDDTKMGRKGIENHFFRSNQAGFRQNQGEEDFSGRW